MKVGNFLNRRHERKVYRRAMGTDSPSTLPKIWWKRWLWYANPKRFKDFWFTKQGKRTALRITGITAGLGFLFIAGLFLYFSKDLPSPGQLNSRRLAQTTRFYDRTGEHLLYEVFGDQNRTFVDLEDINNNLKHATIAIEDKNFYKQGAFSVRGIARAFTGVIFRDPSKGGGSTITQQFVKNALLSPERSLTRKIKELILSIQIEQLYKKDDILELYLNEIPYGAQAYGVQAAAQMYFSKNANEVTLAEAAMLAALPQAPTYYSPYGSQPEELVARQRYVLDLMAEQGYITEEEAEKAKKVDILDKVNDTPQIYRDVKAPHFVLYVEQLLEEKYGAREIGEGGYDVITTLDWDKQKAAAEAVRKGMVNVINGGGSNAALVAGDPNTGEVLAMVGSRDFNYPKFGSFNAATAGRQPGSSFKPYVYAMGFESGDWGPGSVMYDVATDFGGGYRPNNFDNRFKGAMTIRSALAESRNIPAVKMLYIVGLENAIKQAHKMGITTLNGGPGAYGLSLTLGAGEVKLTDHVNAYESFANGGIHRDQVYVRKITDRSGKVLEEFKPEQGERVLSEETTYLISSVLSDDVARAPTFGTGGSLVVPGHTVAGKTGTTDNNRDGWMIGYSKDLVAGVWVGNNDNRTMHGFTSQMTGPIWNSFMRKALAGNPNKPWTKPSGIKTVTLDRYTGTAVSSATRSRVTDVFPSSYRPPAAQNVRNATIDTVSNKLATECTPELARKEVSGQGLSAEIPASDPAYGRWNPPVQALASRLGLGSGGAIPTEKDDVHSCDDELPSLSIEAEQSDEDIIINYQVERGTFKLRKLDITYNGQVISTVPLSDSASGSVSYSPKKDGEYEFEATVTDRGLYTATASSSTNYAAGGEPLMVSSWERRRRHGYN